MRRVLWLLLGLSLAGAAAWAQSYVRGRVGVEDIYHGHGTFNRVVAGDTTVLSKWSPVNALFFGVDNTGASDCTDSLQAALNVLDVAGGGALYLPTGTYLVEDSIAIDSKTYIVGDGNNSTVISHSPASSAPLFYNTANTVNCRFQDFKVSMDSNSTHAFKFDDIGLSTWDRIAVVTTKSGGTAFELDRTDGTGYYNSFYDCSVNGGDTLTYGWRFLSAANENRLIACRSTNVDTVVHITDANGIHVAHCAFEQFGVGVRLPATTGDNCWIAFNRFENSPTAGVGVLVPSGSTIQRLMGNWYSGVTTPVSDNGSGTLRLEDHSSTVVRSLSFSDDSDAGMADALKMRDYTIRMGDGAADPSILWGEEDPTGYVSADTGSIYLRDNIDSTLYVKGLSSLQGWAPVSELRFNVLMHGAVGDGSTDDTDAIQAAITAAGAAGVVNIPPGVYVVDSLVISQPGVTLLGQRSGMADDGQVTVLQSKSGASNPILTINVADGEKGTVIKGIKFDANSEAGVSAALSYSQNQTNWNVLEDLYFENATVAIFADSNFGSLQATHLYTDASCDTALSLGEGTARDISFDQCRFMAEDLVAVIGSDDASGTTTSANITFSQCDLTLTGSGSAGTELMEIRNVHNLVIRDSWIEAGSTLPSTIDGIIVLGTGSAEPRNVIVSGCRIQGNSKAEFGVTLVDALRPHVTENHYVSLDSQLVKVTDTASFGTVSWNSPGSTVSRDDGLLVISGSTTLTDAHFKVRGLTLVAVDTLTNVELGDVYMDAGDSIVKVWNGSDWDNLSDGP